LKCAFCIALFAAGCGGASSDPGLRAMLRVADAQLVPGAMPEEGGGPLVEGLQLLSSIVRPGERARSLQGAAGNRASAVALGLDGDSAYWLIKPGAVDPTTGTLGFKATLSFSPDLPLGPHLLVARGVDAEGRYGRGETRPLQAELEPVTGKLVVSLAWSSDADLDLHVVDPNDVEIWARDASSYRAPPPGTPPDPTAMERAGVLDFDSNSQCLIDGRRRENVIWKATPPSGTYIVRVDTPSLCGLSESRWSVEVRLDGRVVAAAAGVSLPGDADRFTHERGSGVTALVFDVP